MKNHIRQAALICLLFIMALAACVLSGCEQKKDNNETDKQTSSTSPDTSSFLVALEDEPDTVDFQCTSIHYTIAQNVFDRLVETESDEKGDIKIIPSLAESWEISEDRKTYTFHLRKDVTFSNGSALTASDVEYTFTRLLTHPDSCNRDIVDYISGAKALEAGETNSLAGFKVLNDYDFTITLDYPFQAFLACLSMPGASILDKETTEEAGDQFGTEPIWTVGTGSFIFWKWKGGDKMLLTANPTCWRGKPKCEGLDLRFITDPRTIYRMFKKGEIDLLDLDEAGNAAEYFIHGDIYQDRLYKVPRIGISYIALNESVKPLDNKKVRKAMQLALNRAILLKAVYGGQGFVENGIYPHGLYGFNPALPSIPYNPAKAKKLMTEAGYKDGFDLTLTVNSSSTRWELSTMRLAASMWEEIGIHTHIDIIKESDFMRLRKGGRLSCYTALWSADFDDPDNFIYTFFGDKQNTTFRSLCYKREDIMKRVRQARIITDPEERIQEYRDLERIIVQEDAAWIPLYSRIHYYVTSERLEGVPYSWNGSVKNNYRDMSILKTDSK